MCMSKVVSSLVLKFSVSIQNGTCQESSASEILFWIQDALFWKAIGSAPGTPQKFDNYEEGK